MLNPVSLLPPSVHDSLVTGRAPVAQARADHHISVARSHLSIYLPYSVRTQNLTHPKKPVVIVRSGPLVLNATPSEHQPMMPFSWLFSGGWRPDCQTERQGSRGFS